MVSWPFFVSSLGPILALFSYYSPPLTQLDPVRTIVQSPGQGSAPEMVPGPTSQREEEDTARAGPDDSLA